MSTLSLSGVKRVIEQVLDDAAVPGIVVAVAPGAEPPQLIAVGVDAHGGELNTESVFPVASVTKLATALAVLRLVDQGALAFDDLLHRYIPEATSSQPRVTVRSLLCHTSGLPGTPPAGWPAGADWPSLANVALQVPLEARPSTRVAYSGVGYMLLGALLERLTGSAVGDAVRNLVLEPLGIEAYLGTEPPRAPVAIADISGPQGGTNLEPYTSSHWRSVPDPTDGLMTTASGAVALARAFRGIPAGFLQDAMCDEATRDQTGGLAGGILGILEWSRCPWGLGPMLHNPVPPPFTPALAGRGSFGHTGYVWTSPERDVTFAVLGARSYDSGWPISHGPAIEAAVLSAKPI